MPDKLYIVCGTSVGFLVAAFFLVGAHHEIRYRLRQRRRSGAYLIGGDR